MCRRIPILICAVLAAGCASIAPPEWSTALSRDHLLAGRIWNPLAAGYVSPEFLVESLSDADLVLLGEKHDNPDHHRLQGWLIDRIASSGRRPAVVLEMVDEDRQDGLDTWRAGHPSDASGLGPALDWDKSGWPAWREYQPVADAALRHGLPLAAGNLPTGMSREIGRKGISALPEARRRRLLLDQPQPAASRDAMIDIVARGHCDLMPREALAPMVAVQRARDAVLADNMLRAIDRPGADSAVLIAGAGHARRDFGVPAAVAAMRPGVRSVSVAFVEVQDGAETPQDYAGQFFADELPFDFVWFTPRGNDRDYCAELRERFSHKKKKP